MPDWLIAYLGVLQGGVIRNLAAELRTGGIGIAALAFSLGALHALTPGHGKTALAAYFVGREASIIKGLRVALFAAWLHVISGFVAFLVLRFVLRQIPSIATRGSPTFTAAGYGLIMIAGLILIWQALRPRHAHHDGTHALTAGIGLLPCPLTISVLGFAWVQSNAVGIGLVLASLALGVGFTIAIVALLAILARRMFGLGLRRWLHGFERGALFVQLGAGLLIFAIGAWMLLSAL